MKILFFIPSLAGGGQEKAGMILTNYLGRYHDVMIVCLDAASVNDFDYKSAVRRIVFKRSGNTAGKMLVVLKRILQLRKIKRQWKPDVSIAFGPTAMLVNSFCFTKEQKISSIRQSLSKLNSNIFLNKLLFSASGKLVPVHEGINTELYQLYKIKNHLFAYNGYDLEKIRADAAMPVEENLLSFFADKVMVHLGRFDTPKCNWQIVKFFDFARKKMPGLKLLMIGEVDISASINKDIYQFCVKYLRDKGYKVKTIEESYDAADGSYDVIMTGHAQNPHRYLSKADLFIFPSAWEGFPNALVEAMACGLPVISAACPTGPKEILYDKKRKEDYGILLPVFDHHFNALDFSTNELHRQWADAVTGLLADTNKLNYYKQQSLKRANDFSAEKACKKWLDIIEGKIT